MKKTLAMILASTLALSLAACGGSSTASTTAAATQAATQAAASAETQAAAQTAAPAETQAEAAVEYEKLNLKMTIPTGEGGIDYITTTYWADLVDKATDGSVKITVFPNAQLVGGDNSVTAETLIAGGSFELAVCAGALLGNVDNRFTVHIMPFVFSDYAAVDALLDGTGGDYYKKIANEHGIEILDIFHNGLRQTTNSKRVVEHPEDIAGLKIRIPSGEVAIKTYEALGCDPIAMNWGEVYTALQQGTIDGQDNSYMTINSGSIQEVNPYITENNMSYELYSICVNKNDFDSWNEATRQMLRETAAEAVAYGRSYVEEKDLEYKQAFLEQGITITELSDEVRQEWIDAEKPVVDYFIDKFGEEACGAWGLK